MTPIGQPQQDVVAASVKEQEREVGKTKDSNTIGHEYYDLTIDSQDIGIPRVRLDSPVTHCAEYDIDADVIQDDDCLPTGRHMEKASDRRFVASSKYWRIDEPSIEIGSQDRRKWDEP